MDPQRQAAEEPGFGQAVVRVVQGSPRLPAEVDRGSLRLSLERVRRFPVYRLDAIRGLAEHTPTTQAALTAAFDERLTFV